MINIIYRINDIENLESMRIVGVIMEYLYI